MSSLYLQIVSISAKFVSVLALLYRTNFINYGTSSLLASLFGSDLMIDQKSDFVSPYTLF